LGSNLIPLLIDWLPFTWASAERLGLVSLQQMVLALAEALETPVHGTRVCGVPEIRAAQLNVASDQARQTA